MKFQQHFSGSAGNLYEVISSNGKRLLIDPGVPWSKLIKALDYKLEGIVGALLTHEHFDHSKAARDVMKAGIDIYASHGTLQALGLLDGSRAMMLQSEILTQIDGFDVTPFPIRHDAVEPMGFIIKADKKSMLFLTDTGSLDYTLTTPFEIIAIECSYNEKYLLKKVDAGTIPRCVADRLLLNHMSESETLRTLQKFLNRDKCRSIHLLHLSHDNINAERVRKKLEDELMIEVVIV